MGNCGNRQTDSKLNSYDEKLIHECDGSPNCLLNGSLLTSACLWDDLHFDISYICKASYEYVSCYQDNVFWSRVFGEAHKENTAMSADICFGICTRTSFKHKFFGTQFGHECFCGDGQKLDHHPFYKRESECNMPCLEHKDEMCGDSDRMSVYKITTQNLITRSCLKVNQTNIIQDCKTNQLQEDSLCIKFDVFSTDKVDDETSRDQEKEIGNKLYRFCENTQLNGDCIYNLSRFLPADIAMKPPAKFVLCNKSHGKLRNNPETNDYVGNQTITLPNIVDRYDYTRNFETNNSQTLDHKTSTPTYIVLHDDTFKPSPESYDDEYAVVDPTAESSFNESPKESTKCSENCMILDPNQIGIDRSKFAKTNQAYEFAKPIHNTNGHQGGLYALSPEDTYDHSGTTRHHKDQDTIYTHAVDNVYDSASRGVNIARKEDTYDHFFGKETEDEYNISRH
ncbi:Hypothetical predicted protein [Mytilus galloprovincialis]|uniref:WSC domain-containing protein n=1 Tax=Mytilus galloprovincialis TaxID=29158 RepID=A0A8B6H3A7_MYTGA|nr:Hypothetical predicted protein [Mytilus galloprovincialis]